MTPIELTLGRARNCLQFGHFYVPTNPDDLIIAEMMVIMGLLWKPAPGSYELTENGFDALNTMVISM